MAKTSAFITCLLKIGFLVVLPPNPVNLLLYFSARLLPHPSKITVTWSDYFCCDIKRLGKHMSKKTTFIWYLSFSEIIIMAFIKKINFFKKTWRFLPFLWWRWWWREWGNTLSKFWQFQRKKLDFLPPFPLHSCLLTSKIPFFWLENSGNVLFQNCIPTVICLVGASAILDR